MQPNHSLADIISEDIPIPLSSSSVLSVGGEAACRDRTLGKTMVTELGSPKCPSMSVWGGVADLFVGPISARLRKRLVSYLFLTHVLNLSSFRRADSADPLSYHMSRLADTSAAPAWGVASSVATQVLCTDPVEVWRDGMGGVCEARAAVGGGQLGRPTRVATGESSVPAWAIKSCVATSVEHPLLVTLPPHRQASTPNRLPREGRFGLLAVRHARCTDPSRVGTRRAKPAPGGATG